MPSVVMRVSQFAAPCVAVQGASSAAVPDRVMMAESVTASVAPSITESKRLVGFTSSANCGRTTSVSMIWAGLPCAPLAVMVIVSTWVPTASCV